MSAPAMKSTSRHPVETLGIQRAPLKASLANHRPARGQAVLIDRIRGEFLEMRGFSPTLKQAERLFYLPEGVCRDVLARLVNEGFLRVEGDGRFRLSRTG